MNAGQKWVHRVARTTFILFRNGISFDIHRKDLICNFFPDVCIHSHLQLTFSKCSMAILYCHPISTKRWYRQLKRTLQEIQEF